MIRACLSLLLLGVAACQPHESPIMEPGEDCVSCHFDTKLQWTVAGTVYGQPLAEAHEGVEGARIHLTDAEGRELTLRSNSAGNFYSREELKFPLRVEVERDGVRVGMERDAPHGSCNLCHSLTPLDGAPGRVTAPSGE